MYSTAAREMGLAAHFWDTCRTISASYSAPWEMRRSGSAELRRNASGMSVLRAAWLPRRTRAKTDQAAARWFWQVAMATLSSMPRVAAVTRAVSRFRRSSW